MHSQFHLIVPRTYFETSDVKFLRRVKQRLREIKRMMEFIENAATSAGLAPRETMSHVEECHLRPRPASN